jgi:hypothetical protein
MLALFKAYTLLAIALVTTLFSRWLRLGRRFGVGAFHRNYAADRLSAMRAGDYEVLVGAGRCICCRRCEDGDGALLRQHGARYPGMMTLILASARSTTLATHACSAWQLLSNEELELRQAQCPQAVPIVALGALVRHHAALTDSAKFQRTSARRGAAPKAAM